MSESAVFFIDKQSRQGEQTKTRSMNGMKIGEKSQ